MSEYFRKPIVKTLMLKGQAGQSIKGIEKTRTDGFVDTYTITLTDGTTSTFTVTNGREISGIDKTGTSGLVDTYTITFNDGTNSTFTVTNGKGISNIRKTGTSGLVDTYTIEFNDGTNSTFTVTNGKGISNIRKTGTSGLVDTYTIEFNDGTTSTFTVTNGDSAYKPAVDALGKRIDNLILSSGTESSAEVVDARTGYDGTAYETLGTSIRTQVSELKEDLTNKADKYSTGKNLFNKADLFDRNGYFDIMGTFNSNDNYRISNYIEVEPNTTYTLSGYTAGGSFNIWYDSNKIKVGDAVSNNVPGSTPITVTSPSNSKLIKISLRVADIDTVMLEKGNIASAYEPFKKTVITEHLQSEIDEAKEMITSLTQQTSIKKIMQRVKDGTVTRIKLLGDSITHGVGGTGFATDGDQIPNVWGQDLKQNPNGYCWANLFRDYIHKKYPNVTVVNYAQSGWSARNIVANISVLVESTDDIVIVAVGANDRVAYSSISIDQYTDFKNYLQTIYDTVKSKGAECIFVANIPASVTNETSYQYSFHLEDVTNAVEYISQKNNSEYINLFESAMRYIENSGNAIDTILSDGLHPNDIGHKLMFNWICSQLGISRQIDGATW